MTRDNIQTKLDILRRNLQQLELVPMATYAEFASDFRNLASALHLLQTSIQALDDLLVASSKDRWLLRHGVDNSFQTTRRLRRGPWFNALLKDPN